MSSYRALFIEEGREHLETVARLLVELEGRHSEPTIDEVFRHVHSVKGMAASMGYEPIAVLAHRLEDLVAARRRAPLDESTIDLLLAGVDALASQIECIADEKPLSENFTLLRELRESAEVPAAAPEAAPAAPSGSGGGGAPGRAPVAKEVLVRLDEATSAPAVRAFLVLKRLADLVEIYSAEPSEEELRSGNASTHELRFLVSVDVDDTECKRMLRGVADVEEVTIAAHGTPEVVEADDDTVYSAGASSTRSLATVRVRADVLDALIDDVGELFIAREQLRSLLEHDERPDVRAAIHKLGTRIRHVHDEVMAVRMTSLNGLTNRFPRVVRDLCRSLGKDVELVVTGADIEIDRAILDRLDAPFLHVLRNAIDHGMESPAERTSNGKTLSGKLEIGALRDRDMVVVTIADDGRGLDADALRDRAVARGLITELQAAELGTRECFDLICLPGFSTKTEVSDVSGRGVGMDVVRALIEDVGGSLEIYSAKGQGTRFTFRLPLTLAIIPVLLVEVRAHTFALPAAGVVAVREAADDILEQAGGNKHLSFLHALVPVTPLDTMLDLGPARGSGHIVVLEDGRDLYALAVDRIVGYREVVVKPLGELLHHQEWFSGATVLGDGRPVLILDAPRVMRVRAAA